MRIAELLAESTTDDLERLAREHARVNDHMSRHQLVDTIEGVLRSYRFVQEFLFNRQPPAFAMLTLLLDAPNFQLPTLGFRESVLAETARLTEAVGNGDVLRRDEQLRVYRRVLYQARSNDLLIDDSEAAILGVLRQELGVAQVDHFLIEHHADLCEFWQGSGAFERELHSLTSAGLIFTRGDLVIFPDDLAAVVRQVLGIDMSRSAARRLLGYLSVAELRDALELIGAPTSGSKDERIERLIAHMTQPRSILGNVGLDTLRSVCRDIGAPVSGSKESLVDRIIAHVRADRDLAPEPEPPPPPTQEPRRLDASRFGLLLGSFRGLQLAAILGALDLRRYGTKDLQIQILWDAQRSESTLLGYLSNLELEAALRRLNLKASGSKKERIERLVEHFAAVPVNDVHLVDASAGGDTE